MFSLKPDYEKTRQRFNAFWERELIDRPPVNIILPGEKKQEIPQKSYKTHEERWMDVEFRAMADAMSLENLNFFADSLPIAWPNLGPEFFSAMCGCRYIFGESTTWTEPCLDDMQDYDKLSEPDFSHPVFKAIDKYTDLLLEYGKGKFIVGLTDIHPGGDHLAALRDPQNLAFDMIDCPELVKDALKKSYVGSNRLYDYFYNKIKSFDPDMPITTWTPAISDQSFYVPSNDFSCMISKEMFDDVFLQGIADECKYFTHSIYHLDGPGALRHLDSLLSIPELDAVQWVFGAGNEGYHKWVKVYQKIQAAGKGIEMNCHVSELPMIFETLKPEGLWFSTIRGIDSPDTAEKALKRIEKWA